MTPYLDGKGELYCPFENLVGEGCGAKLGVIIGALEYLEEGGLLGGIRRLAGTSASSIIMAAYAAGYEMREIRQIFLEKDMTELLDDDFGLIRDTVRLFRDGGWYKGQALYEWIGELLEAATGNPDITFAQLYEFNRVDMERKMELYIFGTNLQTRFSERYSHLDTPNMPVRLAVRISTAIPLFFVPAENMLGHKCADGGLLNNYALTEFDDPIYLASEHRNNFLKQGPKGSFFNMRTLGIRADDKALIATLRDGMNPKGQPVEGGVGVLLRMLGVWLNSVENRMFHQGDRDRSIFCDTLGFKTTQFDLSIQDKHIQIESGRIAACEYVQCYYGSVPSMNRPDQFDPALAWSFGAKGKGA